ncbi:tRNA (guanine(10)-N2)-methyltransferase [Fusarium oxysporum f. sp. albedinis]|nr:tRNA (guanine(10)-N2)-methyltransferase [Fusarium oxysporum f. sp. albedinis]
MIKQTIFAHYCSWENLAWEGNLRYSQYEAVSIADRSPTLAARGACMLSVILIFKTIILEQAADTATIATVLMEL